MFAPNPFSTIVPHLRTLTHFQRFVGLFADLWHLDDRGGLILVIPHDADRLKHRKIYFSALNKGSE